MRPPWVATKTPNRCPVAPVTNPAPVGPCPISATCSCCPAPPRAVLEERQGYAQKLMRPLLERLDATNSVSARGTASGPSTAAAPRPATSVVLPFPRATLSPASETPAPKRALYKASLPWEQREWLARKPSLGDCQAL